MKNLSTRLLSTVLVLLVLLGSMSVCFASAEGELSAADEVKKYAAEYVQANKNDVTPWGLLEYVKEKTGDTGITLDYSGSTDDRNRGQLDGNAPADANYATGLEQDFFIKHAVQGMAENVTGDVSDKDIPVAIAGTDGGVGAVFRNVDGSGVVYFAAGFDAEADEVITVDAAKTAIMGVNHEALGITTDANGNVTGIPATGVEKLVFPEGYAGTMTDLSSGGKNEVANEVKIVVLGNLGTLKSYSLSCWSSLQAVLVGPKVDGRYLFGSGREDMCKYAFANSKKLKYVSLQADSIWGIYYSVPYFSDYNFYGCSSLSNINFPAFASWANTHFGMMTMYGTAVRDVFAPQYAYDYKDGKSFNGSALTTGTRNVVFYGNPMTAVRAAAQAAAKANTLWRTEGLNEVQLVNVKGAVSGSSDAATFVSNMELTWDVLESETMMGGTLTLKKDDAVFTLDYETERPFDLLSLSVGEYELTPAFNKDVREYAITVPNEVTAVSKDDVTYTLHEDASMVSVTGVKDLEVGIPQNILIDVVNSKGADVQYTIAVLRDGSGDNVSMETTVAEALKQLKPTNKTTDKQFVEDLEKALGAGYTVTMSGFYKYDAVPGAKDYSGVIVPGYNGYITAVITVTDGQALSTMPVRVDIAPAMKEYTYTEADVSKQEDFVIEDNVLISYTGTAKKIVIPAGVEEIVFGWNQSSTARDALVLMVPDSVTTLPPNLAYDMLHLEAAYIGNGVTRLEDQAFNKCVFLQFVRLPETLTTIGNAAFCSTQSLAYIHIPAGVEEIASNAFKHTLARSITVPAATQVIGEESFYGPFNVAEHLVAGVAQPASMAVFEAGDPDVERLQAIIDDTVDYYADGQYYCDGLADAPLGDNSVGSLTVSPRYLTVLNGNMMYTAGAFGSQNIWCSGATYIRIKKGDKLHTTLDSDITKDLANGQGKHSNSYKGVFLQSLDMSLSEAAARAQITADRMTISESTGKAAVEKAIKASYISSAASQLTWVDDLTVSEVDGKTVVTGTLAISDGTLTFPVNLGTVASQDGGPVITPDGDGDKDDGQTGDDKDNDNQDGNKDDSDDSTGDEGDSSSEDAFAVKPTSDIAKMDWTTYELLVVKGVTIEELMKDFQVNPAYTLEFYDNYGDFIPEEYYGVAVLETGFQFRIMDGYNLIEEINVRTVESLTGEETGETDGDDEYVDTDDIPDGDDTDAEEIPDNQNGETDSPQTGDAICSGILLLLCFAGVAIYVLKTRGKTQA